MIETTKDALGETRKKLDLPSTEQESADASLKERQLEKLKLEQELLERERNELVSQQRKERLIREEKERILQEKIDELFGAFETLSQRDFDSLLMSGRMKSGKSIGRSSLGDLDSTTVQSLAEAFKNGMRALPYILEMLPEFLKQFDQDVVDEATRRVEQRLAEEQASTEENHGEGSALDSEDARDGSQGTTSERGGAANA